jgi:hypothetical protein
VHSVALRCKQVQAGASRCKQVQAGAPWRRARALCLRRWPPHTVFEPRGAAEPPETTTRVQNHQRHSVALRGTRTQWHSVALSGTQRYASERGRASGPSMQHPRYSGVIRGHPRSSEAIRVTHGASRGNSTCGERGKGKGRRDEHLHVTHGASRGNSTCRSRSRSGCVRWSISSPALRSSLWLSRTSIA